MKKNAFFPKLKNPNRFGYGCLLWLAVFFLQPGQVAAQCNPDVTVPVAICPLSLTVQSNLNGPNMTVLQAAQLNFGSYDVCSPNILLRATLDLNATAPPASAAVQLVGLGDHDVALWVGDASGNWNFCTTTVTTIAPKCSPDITPPTCAPPPDLTITQDYYQSLNLNLQDSLQMIAAFGALTHWDNCQNGNSLVLVAYSVVTFLDGSPKEITRSFLVIDDGGNTSQVAVQVITILPESSTIHLPGWFYPGDLLLDSMELVSQGTELLAFSTQDLVFTAACNGQKVKIKRTHTIIDWPLFDPDVPPIELPALDLDQDGQTGDPYDVVFSDDSLWLVENGQITTALAPIVGLYEYKQIIRYNYLDTSTLSINGTVFLDTLDNCSLDNNEPTLANWKVKAIGQATGQVYKGLTDATGHYNLYICPGDTVLEVSLDVPFNFGQSCPTVYQMTIQSGQPGVQHIPVKLETSCPLLSVDLSAWRIRPCFPGNYEVSFCNLSNQFVPDAHVAVALDSLLHFDGSNIPGTPLGGNAYDFQVGDLEPGACGKFDVAFTANCAAPVGLTHCSEAHIFPDTICDPNAAWSGASLIASGYCDGDSVRLTLKNIGTATMATSLDFVIVEDLIMYMSAPFQLGKGETKSIAKAANGATWRIQSPQESFHPWGGTVAAFVEGCGGLNQPEVSLAFPLGSSNPFSATDCIVSVGSFDPNDKQAIPRGYGFEHFIEKNTDIEYAIRFQNTGTDTAYTMVILDTLSAYLDIQSIVPGASSHDYDFDILDGQVLRFRFDTILLPDSATNMVASQGFVKYRVRQMPDNPDGRFILNSAAIYFDGNTPVITNYTYHQVGSNFITVSADETDGPLGNLKVYPNPALGEVLFEIPDNTLEGQFVLLDAFGKNWREATWSGNIYRFDRKQLPAGVYFFKIQTADGGFYSGKILLK